MPRKARNEQKPDKKVNNRLNGPSLTSVVNDLQKAKLKRHSRRTRAVENSEDELITIGGPSNPIVIKKPTSCSSRKRKRVRFSRENLYADSLERRPDVDYASKFASGSTAEYTWGIATSQPVAVLEAKRRHQGFRAFGLRRGRKSAFEKFMFGKNSDYIEPFRFMDLPLEIRQKVYGYLLVRPRPILLQSEWRSIYITSTYDHTILLASKQISLESSEVLFKNNVFQTYLGFQSGFSSFRMGTIAERFVSNFKDVIIECRKNNSMLYLASRLATCIDALVKQDTILNSLTIAMGSLRAIGRPDPPLLAPGALSDKTTFADFFEVPASRIMRVIPKLKCKKLNIVIRLPENKRALIYIDLRANPINNSQGGSLEENHVEKWTARSHLAQLKDDLRGLKKRFEDICENPEKAVLEGKARFLGKEESLSDRRCVPALGQTLYFRRPVEAIAIPSVGLEGKAEVVASQEDLLTVKERAMLSTQVL